MGYTNAIATTNYSQALMDQIGQFKWYFAHASVGDNMMDGITDLNTADAGRYQFQRASEDATPPAATGVGRIYDYARGNPGWSAKVTTFTNYVRNGWRYPKVNFAANKFCWIDQDADVDTYINSMSVLEAMYPETLFVYVTMPLDTSSDYDNYLRNVFNTRLRGWVTTNDRVLFDVADIESHDTNGALCAFTYDGTNCQQLFTAYTDDGGHLNGLGRPLVAQGFYAVAAAVLNADRDSDGMNDGHELIAGTCPTSGVSVFGFDPASTVAGGRMLIHWRSTSNRYYSLGRTTNLLGSLQFSNLLTNAAATPPLNTYTDAPGAGPRIYRLGVWQ